ncbi:MAG: hypothetical protein A2521_08175 [Deltaproteobacteria bacterium RIFOXYD12_FULL_57_12]|nr:MAG: hypothetical protein A2521_08175 [Deltaproteobacteria bacterium RIFOXYD12_FULL_57_12]
MLQVAMSATVRNNFGKGAARTLRRQGQTPAVLYGLKSEPVALSMDSVIFRKALMSIHGRNTVVSLDVLAGESKTTHHVMVKEIQKDPVDDSLIHADFLEIALEKARNFVVPLKYVGTAKGIDLGGIMEVHMGAVRVKGQPLNIPDYIEVDTSSLGIGEKLTCQTVNIPAGIDLLEKLEAVCVMVVSPQGTGAEGEEGAGGD